MKRLCRLCLSSSELRQSHIVPEWCYKATYDEKHRAKVGWIDIKAQANESIITRGFVQKGFREYLLCPDCECLLSRWEKWFAEFWCTWSGWDDVENEKVTAPFRIIKNVDYSKFRLFQLSIIWRASVAREKKFSDVALGPYEEKIRKLLLNGDPGASSTFPMYGTLLTGHNGNLQRRLMFSPIKSKFVNTTLYFFVYAGCEWLYVASDQLNHVRDPLKTIITKMNLTNSDNDLKLWVQPYDNANTLRILSGRRGKKQTMPLAFPNVMYLPVVA